jgi:HlyD family secretion protein
MVMGLFQPRWLIVSSLLLLLAVGYALKFWPSGHDQPGYRTETVAKGFLSQSISANGTLNPVVLVNVGTQISGVINKLNADFNDRVEKGQVLAEIDPALIKAQFEQSRAAHANALASLKLAKANEQRFQRLVGLGHIARSELDQAIQAVEAAQAQVAAANGQLQRDRTNLAYTIIKSPVSGVVVSRNVDLGQTVAASFQTPTLFTIAQNLQQMQIDTSVAEADVGTVRVGQDVNFTVDAYPDRTFQGQVFRIRLDSKIVQNVVTYDVVIAVNNPEEILLPGMTAFVSIIVAQRPECLKIPLAALKYKPAENLSQPGQQVYRFSQGQVQAVPIQTGISDGKYIEVVAGGLQAGDSLIVEDLRKQKSGSPESSANFRLRMY